MLSSRCEKHRTEVQRTRLHASEGSNLLCLPVLITYASHSQI